VLYTLDGGGLHPATAPGVRVRPLGADDAEALVGLHPSIAWISDTHDGPEALAASGHAVGAFVSDRLVSLAAVFYLGRTYEEIGVVTDPGHEGQGLSTRCTALLVDAIRARGRTPCWSTTPDNRGSQRVAEKVGFRRIGEQHHFVAGEPVEGALPLA
jgi:predicted GNAT family acetyltransferase